MRYYFSWIVCIILGFLPLVFFPITPEFYDTGKWVLLVFLSLSICIAWLLAGVKHGHYTLLLAPESFGLIALSAASLTSLFMASTNKVEALLMPLGPITWVSFTLLSLLSSVWCDAKSSKRLLWSLLSGATALAVSSLYQFAGLGKIMFPATLYLSDPIWTPTGSLLGSASIFFIMLPLAISRGLAAIKEKNETHIAALSIIIPALIAGLGASIWLLIPRAPLAFLPIRYGLVIMLEILKNPMYMIFGIGAENFLTAFSLGRPEDMIASNLWNTKFMTNISALVHFTTIYGLTGAVATIYFLSTLVHKPATGLSVSLLFSLICFLVIVPNFSVFILVISLMILSSYTTKHHATYTFVLHAIWIRAFLLIAGFFFAGIGIYYLGRAYAAEYVFYKSTQAAKEKRGTDTYDLLIRSIHLNPFITRYHITYSQTNIALASSIQDRDLIAQLVQQAIREAKVAVHLNDVHILAWENLARTYQLLSEVAQGADAWAITAYTRAVSLDPVNPILARDLGEAYAKKKQFTQAITQFRRAIALKPDYTDAWYALSNAYRLNGDIPSAQKALEEIRKLVPVDSLEYRTVSEDLIQNEFQLSPPLTPPPDSAPTTQ